MKTIESFTVDHLRLVPGIYVSRKDHQGGVTLTTFDLRMTAPNREPVIDMPALHTIEHLGATYLRNTRDDVVYFGPMGCRTGFYLILFGDLKPEDVYEQILAMCDFILGYEGDIPGAKPDQCGNWSEQNLGMAKYYIKKYKSALTDTPCFNYPER
jgi:S-ribosylhomocysteine lyase